MALVYTASSEREAREYARVPGMEPNGPGVSALTVVNPGKAPRGRGFKWVSNGSKKKMPYTVASLRRARRNPATGHRSVLEAARAMDIGSTPSGTRKRKSKVSVRKGKTHAKVHAHGKKSRKGKRKSSGAARATRKSSKKSRRSGGGLRRISRLFNRPVTSNRRSKRRSKRKSMKKNAGVNMSSRRRGRRVRRNSRRRRTRRNPGVRYVVANRYRRKSPRRGHGRRTRRNPGVRYVVANRGRRRSRRSVRRNVMQAAANPRRSRRSRRRRGTRRNPFYVLAKNRGTSKGRRSLAAKKGWARRRRSVRR